MSHQALVFSSHVHWATVNLRACHLESRAVSERFSIFNYGLLVVTITHVLTHVFSRIHTALFPVLREEFSLSLQQLGLIAAIPLVCEAILYIPAGLISDRIGSKAMIFLSLMVAEAGAIAVTLSFNSVALTVALSLAIVNTTIYHPPAYSFTANLFSKRDVSKALGILGAGGTLGMALGPIALTLFMSYLNWDGGWSISFGFSLSSRACWPSGD